MSVRDVGLVLLPPTWPKVPPVGLGYLQAYLQGQGIPADIIDVNNLFFNRVDTAVRSAWLAGCNPVFEHSLLESLRRTHTDLFVRIAGTLLEYATLGFSCFRSNWPATLEVIRLLKERKRELRIVLGGPEISRRFFEEGERFLSALSAVADHLIVGEGERGIHAFLKGETCGSKVSRFVQLDDLAGLPFPRYRGLTLSDYPRADTRPLLFSRGCIRRCGFCAERLLFKGFRCRSAASVAEEMDFHLRQGARTFIFFDSMINGDLAGLEALCDTIRERFGSVPWEAQIAVRSDMSVALMEKMKASGCYNLFIGLESGCDRTLQRMHKGFTCDQAYGFFRDLRQAGLAFGISLITGLPGETEADFRESLAFVLRNAELIPKIEQINPFTYYDGTEADPGADYRLQPVALERMQTFVREIKSRGFKYTNAFIGNLVEK